MGLAIICPGQGSQTREMFLPFRNYPEVDPILAAVERQLGFDPRRIPADISISVNRIAQPLLCAHVIATWRVLEPLLCTTGRPLVVLGYSIGEVGAHVISGSLKQKEALQICGKRAMAMDVAVDSPQTMAAVVGLSRVETAALCERYGLEIAIVNGPQHFILGGYVEAVEALCSETGSESRCRISQLPVTVASHTSLMALATVSFAETLRAMDIGMPTVPVLAGIHAGPVRQPFDVRGTLASQLSQTLQWENCLITAREMGASCFLELSPGNTMSGMVRELLPDISARSISEFKSFAGAAAWVERRV